ncbi:MAG: hypothetical protein ACR2OM_01865 [Aestuariivirgaceae bacterium]
MSGKTAILLVLSSLLNVAIAFAAFIVGGFATSPDMTDVTMRIGFYVMAIITITALTSIFAPWILAYRQRHKSALFVAVLPLLLGILAIVAFLLLDSWLQRTFGS